MTEAPAGSSPCPWHGDTTDLSLDDNGSGCFWVVCNKTGCGCEGPYAHSANDAWQKWNSRAIRADVEATPFTGSIPRHAKWCQPGDRQDKRMFIVRFDDQDRNDAVFEDEAEARRFYARATVSWNCYLFGALPAFPEAE